MRMLDIIRLEQGLPEAMVHIVEGNGSPVIYSTLNRNTGVIGVTEGWLWKRFPATMAKIRLQGHRIPHGTFFNLTNTDVLDEELDKK